MRNEGGRIGKAVSCERGEVREERCGVRVIDEGEGVRDEEGEVREQC